MAHTNTAERSEQTQDKAYTDTRGWHDAYDLPDDEGTMEVEFEESSTWLPPMPDKVFYPLIAAALAFIIPNALYLLFGDPAVGFWEAQRITMWEILAMIS